MSSFIWLEMCLFMLSKPNLKSWILILNWNFVIKGLSIKADWTFCRRWEMLESCPLQYSISLHWSSYDGLCSWPSTACPNQIMRPDDLVGSRHLWSVPAFETSLLRWSDFQCECDKRLKEKLGTRKVHGLVSSSKFQNLPIYWVLHTYAGISFSFIKGVNYVLHLNQWVKLGSHPWGPLLRVIIKLF